MHPINLEIRCANVACDFTRDRALPILTVDEPIYRRLPAFLIATVDKFASLPWVGETGAFFGHVDRFAEKIGFYGANDGRREGRPLDNGWKLDPPDLIIQDELHLIAGPLGTVAGLYEAAIDQLASRRVGDQRIRPKIVASTATVRRASEQISALFDRGNTSVFPPPGIDRSDSFFARTVPSSKIPARLYLGIAAQGRGPKLVFLRALTTLIAAAQAAFDTSAASSEPGKNPADPYMTALCYFNALRELGGARRIVEDEVRDRAARYGTQRRRLDPKDSPFADRSIKEPMEITSRVSTDDVAEAKQRLDTVFGRNGEPVDVALATNMISVGLDILRLGLMVVQGQPKTAAEYIQATSRIGRDDNQAGAGRRRSQSAQAARPHPFRAVRQFSPQLLSGGRGDKRDALGVTRLGPRLGGSGRSGGAARRSQPHARHRRQGAQEYRPPTRAAVRDAIVARAPENCGSRRQGGAESAGGPASRCVD